MNNNKHPKKKKMNNNHQNNIKKEKNEKNMRHTESKDVEVNAPAREVWAAYGMLRLKEFNAKYLGHIVRSVEIIEDGGGVGTTLKLNIAPGNYEFFDSYKEKYTKVDMEKRMLEAELTEGGFLDMGFSLFLFRAEVIERSEKSCVIRLTIEYEADEGVHPDVALPGLDFIVNCAKGVVNYVLENKQT